MPHSGIQKCANAPAASSMTVTFAAPRRDPPEIICTHPGKATVLRHFGVDCRQCPRTTGDELCRKSLADPVHTLYLLSESLDAASPAPAAVSFTSFTQLTEHIEVRRHAWLKRELPRLGLMLEHAIRASDGRFAWVRLLAEDFLGLQIDAAAHMCREEQEIFPQLRELDRVRLASHIVGDLTSAIFELQTQHTHFNILLLKLRSWTSHYTFPQGTPEAVRQLGELLSLFDVQHVQHLREEDDLLFQKALARLDALAAG